MEIRFYMSRFMRRAHWFFLCVFIGAAGSLTMGMMLPPVYEAQARLLMEAEQIPGDLALSTVRTQALEQLELTRQRILSRETLLDLADRLGIFEGQIGQAYPEVQTRVDDLRDRITMTPQRGRDAPPLVSIGFRAPTPEMAAEVTNEIVDMILQEDVGMRTRSARKTLNFFKQEVARLDAELAAQDSMILKFREQNKEALPDSLDFRRSQQTTGQERLLQVERQIGALQERRARMARRQEILVASGQAAPRGLQTPEQQQLAQLEEELAAHSMLLSSQNPKVKILLARAEGLRRSIAAQQGTSLGDIGAEPLTDYALQRAEMAGELTFLTAQKDRIRDQLNGLSASVEATTANAMTLGNLERAQANTRAQYDQTIANMARAETGDMIEALRQGQRLSVFESAIVPIKPLGPGRKLLAVAGIAGGAFAGLCLVLLIEGLSKGLRRPEDLTAALGITPFATLPYIFTPQELMRRKALRLGAAALFLIALPVGLWTFQSHHRQPKERVQSHAPKIEISAIATPFRFVRFEEVL